MMHMKRQRPVKQRFLISMCGCKSNSSQFLLCFCRIIRQITLKSPLANEMILNHIGEAEMGLSANPVVRIKRLK